MIKLFWSCTLLPNSTIKRKGYGGHSLTAAKKESPPPPRPHLYIKGKSQHNAQLASQFRKQEKGILSYSVASKTQDWVWGQLAASLSHWGHGRPLLGWAVGTYRIALSAILYASSASWGSRQVKRYLANVCIGTLSRWIISPKPLYGPAVEENTHSLHS